MSMNQHGARDSVEDVVLLGQAMLDETAAESADEGRHTSKSASRRFKSFDYGDSLLTASDIREEVHQELRVFAAQSLHNELMELGAKLKREFRSMLEEVLLTQSKNRLSISSNSMTHEVSAVSDAECTPFMGNSWKEEMRSLIESELSKQVVKSDKQGDGKLPTDTPSRMLKELDVKQSPATTIKAPPAAVVNKDARQAPFFSGRPAFRAYVAQEAMQEFDVKVSTISRPKTGDASGKPVSTKRSHGGLSEDPSVVCVKCGNIFMADARFCRKCGTRRSLEEVPEAWVNLTNGTGADLPCSPEVLNLDEQPADQAAGHVAIMPNGDKASPRTDDSRPKSPLVKKADNRFRKSVKSTMDSLGDALSTRPRDNGGLRMDWEIGPNAAARDEKRSSENSESRSLALPALNHHNSDVAAPAPVRHKLHREAVFITKEAGSNSKQKNKTKRTQDTGSKEMSRLRQAALNVVHSLPFDIGSAFLIAVNALWIGCQVDIMAQHGKEKDTPGYSRALDTTFAVFFSLELALRVFALRLEFFTQKGRMWNAFDVGLVAFQVTEEIIAWSDFFSGNTNSSNSTNFSFMRILRILRFIRVLRLVRIVRLIGELRTIVCSIAGSLKSLGWTIVLMTLQIYVVGIYFTQLVADHGTHDEELMRFFGSLARSILSLFAAFTGGVDWDTLASPLIETIHPLCGVVFALYIAFAVLAMMNVVTGVFVESALMTARHDKDVDLVNTLREVFVKTDEDSTGTIEWDEFERHILDPQMEVIFKAVDLDRSEARGLFELIDVEDKGEISREEFIMGCLRLKGPAKALDLATLMYDMKRMTNMLEDHFSLIEYNIAQPGMNFGEGLKAKEGASNRVAINNVNIDKDEALHDTSGN